MSSDWSAALPDDPLSSHATAPNPFARLRWTEGDLTVADVALEPADAVLPNAVLPDIASRLALSGAGLLPVVDDLAHLVGLIYVDDLLRRVGESRFALTAGELMSVLVVPACRPETKLTDALHQMLASFVRRLPVVDRQNRLLGQLLLSEVAAHAHEEPPLRDLLHATATKPSLWARRWR